MSADHIDPSGILTYTGNLEEVEARAKALKKEAGAIRDKGADVHSSFQGLRAYYSAPEAEQLFASTKPVATKAHHFADELEKVGAALDTFAAEVRPLVARLHKLEGAASHFVADIKQDEDWQYDPVKVAVNKQLIQEVSATVQAFWAAEVAAANKITALVSHGTHWTLGDGTKKKGGHTYGLTKEAMSSAGDTPWGKVVDQKRHWYDPGAVVSWVKNFVWDGTVVDGMWGTLKGLWSLTPWGDNFGAAWKSMGHLATVTTVPLLLPLVPLLPDGSVKSWMTDSMKTSVEVGKSMVAWDQWDKNSGRAAGASFFNIGTLIATRGGSGAVKTGAEAAGAGAKIANAAARVGRVTHYMDPTTHIVNAVGAAAKLTKLDAAIGSAFKAVKTSTALDHLRETFTVTAKTSPSGAVHLPSGQPVHLDGPLPDLPPGKTAIHLADGAGKVPPGSMMYDRNTFLTPDSKVVDAHGIPKTGSDAMAELSAKNRAILGSTPPEKADVPAVHELARVGADVPAWTEATVRAGDLGNPSSNGPGAGDTTASAQHDAPSPNGPGESNAPESIPGHSSGGHSSLDSSVSSGGVHDPVHGGTSVDGSNGGSSAVSDGHTPDPGGVPHVPDGDGDVVVPVEASNEGHWGPKDVEDQINKLDDRQGGEGHAPGRHLYPKDDALIRRLGTPMADGSGNLKLYGPASPNVGHVKSENNVDPLTGTTTDGVSGGVHRVGGCATRFDNAEDLVKVDAYARKYIAEHGTPPSHEIPISGILGPDGHKRLSGFYRNPQKPSEFLPVDFEGGTIKAVYKYKKDYGYYLVTMYPNHAPGRHP
ncbi:hypothetical protein [Streptomyces natalensis]|uniref:hypothetical protein n=1 Tax=Streptomyces natalensis TaxID=68242 RepID=UPI00068EA087|nr:hypothetical protein [Streptomyces natalensis]